MVVDHKEFDPYQVEPLLEVVAESFDSAAKDKIKKRKPTRIKIDGEYIKTDSGKTIWAMPGHAKSALRNHVEGVLRRYAYKHRETFGSPYNLTTNYEDVVINRLIDEGRLEYVEVENF